LEDQRVEFIGAHGLWKVADLCDLDSAWIQGAIRTPSRTQSEDVFREVWVVRERVEKGDYLVLVSIWHRNPTKLRSPSPWRVCATNRWMPVRTA
jgi:hypothetical protein